MKIAVIGYSGAGKSTLARALGERYSIPVLHLDQVQFTTDWQERDRAEAQQLVREFMEQPSWVMDGNYTKFEYERRLLEADRIIILDFPRLICFVRAWKRFFTFHGKTRPDMADGCLEKIDPAFMWWILWKGHTRQKQKGFQQVAEKYPAKTVILHNQRDIDQYLEGFLC